MCKIIEDGGSVTPPITTGAIEAMAAGDVLRARAAAAGDVAAGIRGTYAALRDAAAWTRQALAGA